MPPLSLVGLIYLKDVLYEYLHLLLHKYDKLSAVRYRIIKDMIWGQITFTALLPALKIVLSIFTIANGFFSYGFISFTFNVDLHKT